ncbi:MAG TPA: hypothetical protein VNK96_04250 [Fimbriimonadales bacterium]|nr:hypothetical protein [Fimbriimonadales bacterium]
MKVLSETLGNALQWKVHLARKNPGKAMIVLMAAITGGLLGLFLSGTIWMAIIGFVVIVASLADFLLPIYYRLDEQSAKSRCGFIVSEIRWENVKRVIEGDDGIKLSPLEKPSRLSPFRGVFLRTNGNKEEILERIAYYREKHASTMG